MGTTEADGAVERPAVFISHRVEDRAIAERITESLSELFGDNVGVFNTTGEFTDRVRPGEKVHDAVMRGLAKCSVVLLVYTVTEADWSWCFHECGLAIDPAGEVSTKVIIIDLAGTSPEIFKDQLQIEIEPELDGAVDAPDGEVGLRTLLTELCKDDGLLREAEDPPVFRDGVDEADVPTVARMLHRDLVLFGPASERRLSQTMLDNLTALPVRQRHERFGPLLRGASDALSWGLKTDKAIKELFLNYWDEQFLSNLTDLAKRRLVFSPGRVSADWNTLLELLGERFEGDLKAVNALGRPLLSLVSYEERDPLGFWELAQDHREDASHYERPVRELAERMRDSFAGQDVDEPFVRRVIILPENFVTGPDEAERLVNVATWMAEGDIDARVAYVSDTESEWRDFGLVGNIAVSRFRGLERSNYRSLVEDFDTDQITMGERAWKRLPDRWAAQHGLDVDSVLAKLGPPDRRR